MFIQQPIPSTLFLREAEYVFTAIVPGCCLARTRPNSVLGAINISPRWGESR